MSGAGSILTAAESRITVSSQLSQYPIRAHYPVIALVLASMPSNVQGGYKQFAAAREQLKWLASSKRSDEHTTDPWSRLMHNTRPGQLEAPDFASRGAHR
jgi:hypothetical protein